MVGNQHVERLDSRVVYRNPWMTVREDTVRRPDGSTGLYGVVDKPDYAVVMPRADDGFWLVEQYRYPVGRRTWEFPQGSWSGDARGDSYELARSELAEETGLHATHLRHLGHLHGAYGFCSQGFDVFLATGLSQGTPDREHTEQDMTQRLVPDDEIIAMISAGMLTDGASVAALALYLIHDR